MKALLFTLPLLFAGVFSWGLSAAENTIRNAFTLLYSGNEKGWESFAPDFRHKKEGKTYTLPQLRDQFASQARLLQLAEKLEHCRKDPEIMAAFLSYLGQDPALAEHFPPETLAKVKKVLPFLQRNIKILFRTRDSLQVTKVEIKGETAHGVLSCILDGRSFLCRLTLIRRDGKWLIRTAEWIPSPSPTTPKR